MGDTVHCQVAAEPVGGQNCLEDDQLVVDLHLGRVPGVVRKAGAVGQLPRGDYLPLGVHGAHSQVGQLRVFLQGSHKRFIEMRNSFS